jgi:hypothetical protein
MYGTKHASHCLGSKLCTSIRDVHIVATYASASSYSVLLLPSSRIVMSSSLMCSATVCTTLVHKLHVDTSLKHVDYPFDAPCPPAAVPGSPITPQIWRRLVAKVKHIHMRLQAASWAHAPRESQGEPRRPAARPCRPRSLLLSQAARAR